QRLSAVDNWLDGASDRAALESKVKGLYAGSNLDQLDARMKWFKADTKAINASKDSMLVLARKLQPQLKELSDADDAMAGRLSALRPRYMQALIDWKKSK